jgi:O-antigen/teichoic acid export membrane protein
VPTIRLRWQSLVASNIGRRLGRNLGWLLIGNVSSLALGFATTAYLARMLGQAEFGIFSYAQTIALYATFLVDLGLNVYGTRAVARHPDRSHIYLAHIITLQSLAGIAVLLVGLVVGLTDLIWPSAHLRHMVMLSLLWVVPFAWNVEWLYLGLEQTRTVGSARLLQQLSMFVLVLFLVGNPTQSAYAPLLRVAGGVVSALWLFSRLPEHAFARTQLLISEIGSLVGGAKWFWWSALLLLVSRSSDVIIIQASRPAREIGQYSASMRLVGVVTASIGILNTVMFAMLAAEREKESRNFAKLLNAYLLLAGGIAGVALTVGLSGASLLMTLVYGASYAGAAPIFCLLLIAGACLVLQGAIEQPLLACGYERSVFAVVAATAGLSVAANLTLVPRSGAYGAAISFLSCSVFSAAALFLLYRHAVRYGNLRMGPVAND